MKRQKSQTGLVSGFSGLDPTVLLDHRTNYTAMQVKKEAVFFIPIF